MEKVEKVLVVRKCKCGSPWCHECRVGVPAARQADRLRRLDWRKTRTIMLSVSRDDFGRDGSRAYDFVTERKKISQFIRDLQRHEGVSVGDWVWFLEWNDDGFPHWHLFLETVAGREGQIGGDVLRRHWDWGEYVHEGYIRDEKHWKAMTGYLGKRGYFNPAYDHPGKSSKSHQAELPAWALDRKAGSIRKFSGRRRKCAADGGAADGGAADGGAADDGAADDGASDDGASDDGASDDGASDDGAVIELSGYQDRDRSVRSYSDAIGSCGGSCSIEVLEGQKILNWDFWDLPAQEFGELGASRVHRFRPNETTSDSAAAGRRRSFFRLSVPYSHVLDRWPGEYDQELGGYAVELCKKEYDLFMALYDLDIDKRKAA